MTQGIERQVNRVQQRLFLTSFLSCLAWCWSAALLLAAAWFFVQPLFVEDGADWLRWSVLGGLMAAATVTAAYWAVRDVPNAVLAALSLDEKFGLKERATTAITLDTDSAQTPVGRALLADADSKVAGLDVASRFPVQMPRSAAYLPLGALALLLALWMPLQFGSGTEPPDDDTPLVQAKSELEQQMKKLAQAVPKKQGKAEVAKKQNFEEIDADLERFTRQPRDTPDQVKQRIKEAMALEEAIKQKQKANADRAEAIRDNLKQQARLKRKKRGEENKAPEGKLDAALARGDMADAADELKRLGRKLENEGRKKELKDKLADPKLNEADKKAAQEELDNLDREQNMTDKERAELEKQLEELEKRLNEMKKDKEERKKEVDEKEKRGEIDKDEADREKNEIDKNDEKLDDQDKKDAEDLAKKVGECKQCMKEGKNGEAGQKLKQAGEKAGKMGGDKDQDGLGKRLNAVREVKKALCRAAGGPGGPAAGQRPLAKEGEWNKEEKLSPSDTDKGRLEVVGDGPKGGFKGPRKPQEMVEDIRRAAQEAPAAIDRQRLPPAARKMARGYFEKMRGQDDKAGKKP
jgi:hypothetical protein